MRARIQKGKVRRGYCLVILIKTNLQMDIKYYPIKEDILELPKQKTYHLASAEYIMYYKKYPVIILPEWNLLPFNPKENYREAYNEGSVAYAQKVVIDAIVRGQLKGKKGFDAKILIFIILGAVAGLFILSQVVGT
jgi:hypothetical protein